MTTITIIATVLTVLATAFYFGYIRGMKALEKEIDEGLKRLKEDKEDPSEKP